MMTSCRVAIAGGSLGGLTTGLLLRDLGCDVRIYERSPAELEQRGAGIGFLPESYRYLVERAGVRLDDISTLTERIRYLSRTGDIVHDELHSYRFSSWNTVYRQLLDCFGRECYRLASEVDGFTQDPDGVDVHLADGTNDRVDLLVCADGIGSRFRTELQGTVEPAFAGYVAWRGMVPVTELDKGVLDVLDDAITYYVYANSHILVYPIPGTDGSVASDRRLMNFVWYRNYLAGGDLADVLTDANGIPHEISVPPGAVRADHVAEVRATAAARLPAVFAAVVRATESPFLQVIFDVEVTKMAFGRVCLVGDAAWVARPHAAAGTAKAAADGWALADALATHDDIAGALAAWEPGQLALGRQLVDRTRRIGSRSQVECDWRPGDPELIFGLLGPGR